MFQRKDSVRRLLTGLADQLHCPVVDTCGWGAARAQGAQGAQGAGSAGKLKRSGLQPVGVKSGHA